MQIATHTGTGFRTVHEFEGWKVALIRYNPSAQGNADVQRHRLTEETFVLLEGEAVLYEEDVPYPMVKTKVYTVERGAWHRIAVSEDGLVLVVENSNTSKENTERQENGGQKAPDSHGG